MELVTLASGQVIRIFTGWRAWLVVLGFGVLAVCSWELGKAIGKACRRSTI